jgi:molybdopterin-guanine dinucleotide biosynthesis protein A
MTGPRQDTLAVILAGGLARRIGGGDKPLRLLGGRPILAHVIARIAPQVAALVINANGDATRFAGFGLPMVQDGVPGHPGPLAGVLAALDWAAAERPDLPWVLSVTGDAPFLPRDLAEALHRARAAAATPLACARSAASGQRHPAIGLWPVTLRAALRAALAVDIRRVDRFAALHGAALADWHADPIDPFFNINTPADLTEAERLLPLAR